jgi:hypothetical protein
LAKSQTDQVGAVTETRPHTVDAAEDEGRSVRIGQGVGVARRSPRRRQLRDASLEALERRPASRRLGFGDNGLLSDEGDGFGEDEGVQLVLGHLDDSSHLLRSRLRCGRQNGTEIVPAGDSLLWDVLERAGSPEQLEGSRARPAVACDCRRSGEVRRASCWDSTGWHRLTRQLMPCQWLVLAQLLCAATEVTVLRIVFDPDRQTVGPLNCEGACCG